MHRQCSQQTYSCRVCIPGADEGSGRISDSGRPRKALGNRTCNPVLQGVVNEPFAVINADDYYGRSAFEELYRFLTTHHDDEKYRYAMVGYQLGNT